MLTFIQRTEFQGCLQDRKTQSLGQEVEFTTHIYARTDCIMMLLTMLQESLSKLLKAWSKSTGNTVDEMTTATSNELISCMIEDILQGFEQLEELSSTLETLVVHTEKYREQVSPCPTKSCGLNVSRLTDGVFANTASSTYRSMITMRKFRSYIKTNYNIESSTRAS